MTIIEKKRKHEVMDDVLLQADINKDLLNKQESIEEDTQGWFSDKEYDQYSNLLAKKYGKGLPTQGYLGNVTELWRNLLGLFTGRSAYDADYWTDLTYQGKPVSAKLQEDWRYLDPKDLKGIDLETRKQLDPYIEEINRRKYSDKRLFDLATRGGK